MLYILSTITRVRACVHTYPVVTIIFVFCSVEPVSYDNFNDEVQCDGKAEALA